MYEKLTLFSMFWFDDVEETLFGALSVKKFPKESEKFFLEKKAFIYLILFGVSIGKEKHRTIRGFIEFYI